MTEEIVKPLIKLLHYCERENFKGYDPYDTLNSSIDFNVFGKWVPAIATQVQKRNPINIRPLIGIEKDYNPKGMGLLLKAYCNLYEKTGNAYFLKTAKWLFDWLVNNYSTGFSGMAWGYPFPWASSEEYKRAFMPSVVVTAHVIDGIYSYFRLTGDENARRAIVSAANYVLSDIPISEFDCGISFAYTHQSTGVCYNASLLAAEILLKASKIRNDTTPGRRIEQAVRFVISRQHNSGCWHYSYNPEKNSERRQIDFHQGFVLVSLYNIKQNTDFLKDEITRAITKGLAFYKNEQFLPSGRSLWRHPQKWPVDIHNQSQGIITFTLLQDYHPDSLQFAKTIANWTINNMQDSTGYFYYRKYPFITNKLSFMRWSQAWMLLALSELAAADKAPGNNNRLYR